MPTALLSTLPSDAHGWNLVFLEMYLREQGFAVVQLGVCTPIALVLETCAQRPIDLVVVSTVNGLGHLEAGDFARAFRAGEQGLPRPLAIGGKLGLTGGNGAYVKPLLEAGFSRVFEEDALDDFADWLQGIDAADARRVSA